MRKKTKKRLGRALRLSLAGRHKQAEKLVTSVGLHTANNALLEEFREASQVHNTIWSARRLKDSSLPPISPNLVSNTGVMHVSQGSLAAASILYAEAESLRNGLTGRNWGFLKDINESHLYRLSGSMQFALKQIERGLNFALSVKHDAAIEGAIMRKTDFLVLLGRMEEAQAFMSHYWPNEDTFRTPMKTIQMMDLKAGIALAKGSEEEAFDILTGALVRADKSNYLWIKPPLLCKLARIDPVDDPHHELRLTQALSIARSLDDRRMKAEVFTWIAEMHIDREEFFYAEVALRNAKELAVEMLDTPLLAIINAMKSFCDIAAGKRNTARESISKSSNYRDSEGFRPLSRLNRWVVKASRA